MAFSVARERWRGQRLAAFAAPSPAGYEPILASEEMLVINELTQAVQGLEDVLEVQPFAGDLGEYVWFRRALAERASAGWMPNPQDARRALVFVAGWVVRWEIFTLGYPDDRWEAHELLSNVVDSAMKNDQAATLSSCVVVSSSVTLMPSLNFTPASTSATSSWPLNRRQRSCADSSSL
jgi:hypothetical protein